MAEKNQVHVDPANLVFAKAMEIVTYIGIAVMIVFGLLYLFGLSSFVDMKAAIAHWHLPVGKFWHEVAGIHISGYDWFLKNLTKSGDMTPKPKKHQSLISQSIKIM